MNALLLLVTAATPYPVDTITARFTCFETRVLAEAYRFDGFLHAFKGRSPAGDIFEMWISPEAGGDFVWTVTRPGSGLTCPIAGGVAE